MEWVICMTLGNVSMCSVQAASIVQVPQPLASGCENARIREPILMGKKPRASSHPTLIVIAVFAAVMGVGLPLVHSGCLERAR
ncbi:hypothetical protein [Diaphorobacter caeni]|uniref:hypothetical protein n=1 Tax=Diaphorobacter caeni TaxID=2784387 RepID=UPI00188F2006|nr:hypothetical protein [Diaphorobacter caeni]MBF5003066.1 hypothetical protein [Diaphorobacter caeni]